MVHLHCTRKLAHTYIQTDRVQVASQKNRREKQQSSSRSKRQRRRRTTTKRRSNHCPQSQSDFQRPPIQQQQHQLVLLNHNEVLLRRQCPACLLGSSLCPLGLRAQDCLVGSGPANVVSTTPQSASNQIYSDDRRQAVPRVTVVIRCGRIPSPCFRFLSSFLDLLVCCLP